MNILICGAGAMGSLFGALLARSGARPWLLSHWTEHLAHIRSDGLILHQRDGRIARMRIDTLSYDEPLPGPFDLAFLSVKSHATAEAAARVAAALAPGGVAITMQNGLGNRELLAEALGEGRALLGVTAHGATLLGPGEVRHAGEGPTVVAAEPDAAWAERIAALLGRAGIATTVEPAVERVLWNKLLVNIGINALTAILRVPNGALAESEAATRLLHAAVEEGATVARARGILVPPDAAGRALAVARATASNRSSMLSDILRGAPTEIEVMNGAIVREGAALGIPTPVNAVLADLVRAAEAAGEQRLSASDM